MGKFQERSDSLAGVMLKSTISCLSHHLRFVEMSRVWFYMEWAYPGRITLTDWDRTLYTVWSEADPVDAAEKAWAQSVFNIQGNENPFVK